jgi:hypothetical protein
MKPVRPLLAIAAALLAVVTPAGAQDTHYPTRAAPVDPPVYKCGGTYTHVNCGGRQVNGHRVTKTFDKNTLPPQDRARKIQRAMLPPETRKQCADLEGHIRKEEVRLKTKQEPVTEAEEGNLAIQRVHYRELRC